jgi:hypothetical protein
LVQPSRIVIVHLNQQLERYLAFVLGVLDPVDLALAASTDGGDDFVRTDSNAA